VRRWPWPADTPTDRARRVAQSYRQALQRVAPATTAALDREFSALGETWVAPLLASVNLDEWVTIPTAAEYVGLTPAAVYKWVYRGRLEGRMGTDRRLRVHLRAALDANAEIRRERATRATSPET
jgi:alkylhydroperoxidase/carboxymuconolactone decarboxylase family protein YurZ